MCMYPMIDFYCESVSRDVCASTVAHHTDMLERIFTQMKDLFGVEIREDAINGLSGAVLQRWINKIKQDRKPTTVNSYVVTLNKFLRWAHKIYPDTVSDLSGVLHCMKLPDPDKIPVEERPKDKYYTDAEISRLLAIPKRDSTQKKRDRAVIAMFLGSGLRVSELCSLNIGDIDGHEHGSIYVRRKGGAWKDVNVAGFVYPFIESYLRTREDRADKNAPLFVTSHGQRCSGNQMYKAMRTKQNKAGVSSEKARGSHTFRHTFISEVEKIGGGAVARDLANHKSLTITNRYDHSTKQQRCDAVNALHWGT